MSNLIVSLTTEEAVMIGEALNDIVDKHEFSSKTRQYQLSLNILKKLNQAVLAATDVINEQSQ